MKKGQTEIEKLIEYLEGGSVSEAKTEAEEYASWVKQPVFAYEYTFSPEESLAIPALPGMYCLLFIKSGSAKILIANECQELNSDKGVGVTHSTGFVLTQMGEEKTEMDFLVFSLASIFSYGTTALSAKYATPFQNLKIHQFNVFDYKTGVGADMYKLVESVMEYADDMPYGYELMIRARMCELWYIIVRAFIKITPVREVKDVRKDEQRVKQAMEYVKLHYTEQITLEDIARELSICKSECCRCFKRVMDLTPIEYVVRYRIYTAAFLLDEPVQKKNEIASIAVRVGFNNISYFNKMFKKYMGLTPTEYRLRGVNDEKIMKLKNSGILI